MPSGDAILNLPEAVERRLEALKREAPRAEETILRRLARLEVLVEIVLKPQFDDMALEEFIRRFNDKPVVYDPPSTPAKFGDS